MKSDLNMYHGKMSGVVSFPLFGFTLAIKLRNINLASHENVLILFHPKNDVRFDYVSLKSVGFGLTLFRINFFGADQELPPLP